VPRQSKTFPLGLRSGSSLDGKLHDAVSFGYMTSVTRSDALLARTLREAREDFGLSIRSIAEKAGISAAQVSRMERGLVERPSMDTLASIARALDRNPIPLWVVAEHVGGQDAVALMRDMLPSDAEIFEEWGDDAERAAALRLVNEAEPDPLELRWLAARVFKTFETEETLWDTYAHRLARGAQATSGLVIQGAQPGVTRQWLALVEVVRHLPQRRLAKVVAYANDQFEAEFGRPFEGSAEVERDQRRETGVVVKQVEESAKRPFTRRWLELEGFDGFMSIAELRTGGVASVPSAPGAYVVLREAHPATFLEQNRGGRFKQKDPTVPLALLKGKWVDGSDTVYVGKGNDLRRRIKEFIDFGAGMPVGHWGGRYTWQLANSAELLIAWKRAPEGKQAREVETELLATFGDEFGVLPFANLSR
jgi:transcriptional regulator with XRE-family HTH domain